VASAGGWIVCRCTSVPQDIQRCKERKGNRREGERGGVG